jgi:hypothetical protein
MTSDSETWLDASASDDADSMWRMAKSRAKSLKRLGVFNDGKKLKTLLTRWECSIERLCERRLSVYLTLPDPTIC